MMTLQEICIAEVLQILEKKQFHPKLINQLCKWLPDHLLEPVFYHLVDKEVITDVTLIQFLVPSRIHLYMPRAINVMNSTLKQIGYNCPNLLSLNLSDCNQVTNTVIREILHGCPMLSHIVLDRCYRITDSMFDYHQCPFSVLFACYSLESISLQGCPQIRGNLMEFLNKNCRKLRTLNLSQCKNLVSSAAQCILEHNQLKELSLAFIETLNDDVFAQLPSQKLLSRKASVEDVSVIAEMTSAASSIYAMSSTDLGPDLTANLDHGSVSPPVVASTSYTMAMSIPLVLLNLSHSVITDITIRRLASLSELSELQLGWCQHISDDAMEVLFSQCTKLRKVDLKSCPISDKTLGFIAQYSANLVCLDVSWCNSISDSGIAHFVPDSTTLGSQNLPTSSRLETAGSIGSATGGHSMDPTHTDIDARQGTSRGICQQLEMLCMKWCPNLTNASLVYIEDIPSLRSLFVTGCQGIDGDAMRQLAARRTMLSIDAL